MTILDGKFSNDGKSIYCTDGNGRLIILDVLASRWVQWSGGGSKEGE